LEESRDSASFLGSGISLNVEAKYKEDNFLENALKLNGCCKSWVSYSYTNVSKLLDIASLGLGLEQAFRDTLYKEEVVNER